MGSSASFDAPSRGLDLGQVAIIYRWGMKLSGGQGEIYRCHGGQEPFTFGNSKRENMTQNDPKRVK